MGAAQLAADIAAWAAAAAMGKDICVPPGTPGMILMGSPNVLVGGFPMPSWLNIAKGLLKIFDEVFTNAIDRQYMKLKTPLRNIWVTVDPDTLEVSVKNDGDAVPVVIDTRHKEPLYLPTIVFGRQFSGTNFDDSKPRFTGGRNGVGAKATSVYSNPLP